MTNWKRIVVDLHHAILNPNPKITNTSNLDTAVNNLAKTIQSSILANTNNFVNQSSHNNLPNYIKLKITKKTTVWSALILKTNWAELEAIQNIALCTILSAPLYVRNTTIRNSIKIPTVKEELIHLTRNLLQRNDNVNYTHLRNICETLRSPEIYKQRPHNINTSKH